MLVCAFSMPRERCRKNLRIFIARMIFFLISLKCFNSDREIKCHITLKLLYKRELV